MLRRRAENNVGERKKMNSALFRGGIGSHLEGIYIATAPDPGPVCRGAGLGEFNFVYHVHLAFEISLLFFYITKSVHDRKNHYIITLSLMRVTPRRLKSADAPAPGHRFRTRFVPPARPDPAHSTLFPLLCSAMPEPAAPPPPVQHHPRRLRVMGAQLQAPCAGGTCRYRPPTPLRGLDCAHLAVPWTHDVNHRPPLACEIEAHRWKM